MIYLLSYNDGFDSEFDPIYAYRSIEGLLGKVREMEKNDEISLELFEDTDEDGSFEEMLYEIEDEDSFDDYGESVYRYYRINKMILLD